MFMSGCVCGRKGRGLHMQEAVKSRSRLHTLCRVLSSAFCRKKSNTSVSSESEKHPQNHGLSYASTMLAFNRKPSLLGINCWKGSETGQEWSQQEGESVCAHVIRAAVYRHGRLTVLFLLSVWIKVKCFPGNLLGVIV